MSKEIRRKISRMLSKARNFPHNTCPASRHAAEIAQEMARLGDEDSLWKAESIAITVADLWEARTELARKEGGE